MASLSEQDLAHLDFAVAYADMVGLSFVRSPQDVLDLERELDRRGGSQLGIVLKVETRVAFEQLPNLLLTALQSPPVGVMVARGDLAVEMGFERLAEVQEQILWLCEAAHVPVIWATQVLESLAKKGLPSRAEVTDAAMSGRAECVMLNKGPHVLTCRAVLGQRHDPHAGAPDQEAGRAAETVGVRPACRHAPGPEDGSQLGLGATGSRHDNRVRRAAAAPLSVARLAAFLPKRVMQRFGRLAGRN